MNSKMYLSGALAAALLTGFFLSGCSKDEDPAPDTGKKAKITFSVSNEFSKAEGDHLQVSVGAADSKGTFIDWKVDGETEKGTVVFVNSDYVDGGKSDILIESVQRFATGSVSIGTFNIAGEPFTITYKIEVNGEIVDEQSYEIADGNDALAKSYQL